ncbi:restriction endonuclease subunit S [Staphylococcus aureus]|uniref:restriction endonuclease subunit S n=1 Tax=Staphylococcus aureus TaxID=1280 RepID=UPI00091C59A9|nr:restriction endonuclease subunit S [Staphylococcus aureus]SGS39346.1 type I restriction modification DNA specificity domain protein [Staphylococcus aureus]
MSNTQTKNVPELRFPGFEGEYSLDIFGNLATNKSDKFNPQNENASIDIELDCIEQNTGRLIKIYNSKEFSSQKNKFNPQNVLYGKLRPYLNKYYFTKKSGVCSSEIWVLKSTKEDKLLNLFLYYFIQTKRYSDVASKSAGSKMPRADWGLIENIRVYFPELCEQQKIGEFFSKLDRQIELEEQKLELLQQQKKGYMQKIFSQELRFKDENGNDYPEWEETTIKEIAQINTGKKDTKDAITNGSYDFYVRSPIVYKINTFSYEGEAILTVGDGVGVGKVFHYVNGKFDYHQRVYKISDFKNYYGLLLFYYFSQNFLKETKKYSAKTSVDSVRKDMIANMKVPRPIYIEQEKIGQFIKKVDNKIKIQKQVIELLKQRKKALLQKMFI